MEVFDAKVEMVHPYDKNPRNISQEAVDKVAASIKEFGFQQPIVVDDNMVVIVGHTRLKAAKQLGLKWVPVTVAKGLTDEQIRAYRLADNKTNEFTTSSTWSSTRSASWTWNCSASTCHSWNRRRKPRTTTTTRIPRTTRRRKTAP